MSDAPPADGCLRKLEIARAGGGDVSALVREARARAEQWEREAVARGLGEEKQLYARLFSLGVLDEPPLSGVPYRAWLALDGMAGADLAAAKHGEAEGAPFLSVLMPVYNPRPEHLDAALRSVRAQTWQAWELCLADDASGDPAVREIILRHAGEDSRIRPVFRPVNGHICAASNTALENARGDWCLLADHDDVLPPEAFELVAEAIARSPGARAVFSDEDRLDDDPRGRNGPEGLGSPLFKPGFDPDLLLACNAVSHLGAYHTETLRRLGGFRPGTEGSQDYDLALRVLADAGPGAFVHVPRVLYHWRRYAQSTSMAEGSAPRVKEAALRARRDFAAAAGWPADIAERPGSSYADVRFRPPDPAPLLTLIVLLESAGRGDALRALLERVGYAKREIVLAFPDDAPADARKEAGRLAARHGARCAAFLDAPALARGKILGFVRAGDIPLEPDWPGPAVGALCRAGVAVAGCRSFAPGGFLRGAGYAAGYTAPDAVPGAAGAGLWMCPAYAGLHRDSGGYFQQAHLARSVPAVYGSGLFCRKKLWERLGGFRPAMGALADADFCLRAWRENHGEHGRSVIAPGADLLSAHPLEPVRAEGAFADAWGDLLRDHLPFQSPHLAWAPGGWRFRRPGPRGETALAMRGKTA